MNLKRIETALDVALIRSRSGSCPPKLAAAIEYSVKPGGARIRPTICLSVAMACGDDQPRLTDAACTAIELLHCGSLVHDDLPAFDNADTRRGKPSVHKAYSQPLAILSGDTLIIMAFEQIALAAADDAERGALLVRELARFSGMPHGICAGQGWESECVVDLSAYHRAKTGALFTAATRMGAAAAGEDPEAWTELGARIGEAFQVADDLRDALYDEQALGKPAGQDAVNNRPNAVSELGVQGAIKRLDDILSGAISSIPSCRGEAMLAEMVRKQAERLTPVLPNIASIRTA
jgi:geranylgeranyl diphosphate synthase type II